MELKNAVTGFILAFFLPLLFNYFLLSSNIYFAAQLGWGAFLLHALSFLLALGIFYYYAVEKYWITDSNTIMLSSIGFLLMGIAGMPMGLQAIGFLPFDLNAAGQYYLVSMLVASILIVSCVFIKDHVSKKDKERLLAIFVVLFLIYILALTALVLFFSSSLPQVFGSSGELLPWRSYMAHAVIITLSLTSIYFARVFAESKNEVLFWFSVGLALLIMSEITWAAFQKQFDDVYSWLGRIYRLAGFAALLIGMKQVYME